MGRKRKVDVEGQMNASKSVIGGVIDTPKVDTPAAEAPVVKATKITISASYKTKTVDGEIIKHRFSGSGSTLLEALDDVQGSDEEIVDEYGAKFPSKVNLLVNVTVKRGDYQFDRAIAPQVTEAIFTNKNVALLSKLFGV